MWISNVFLIFYILVHTHFKTEFRQFSEFETYTARPISSKRIVFYHHGHKPECIFYVWRALYYILPPPHTHTHPFIEFMFRYLPMFTFYTYNFFHPMLRWFCIWIVHESCMMMSAFSSLWKLKHFYGMATTLWIVAAVEPWKTQKLQQQQQKPGQYHHIVPLNSQHLNKAILITTL